MYLPLHGRIVAKRPDGRRLGRMELGRAIGQESMLTGQPLRFTVEAESDVLVLRMSVSNFSALLMKRPDVVQRIEMLSHARG